jgi:hypothetical protein
LGAAFRHSLSRAHSQRLHGAVDVGADDMPAIGCQLAPPSFVESSWLTGPEVKPDGGRLAFCLDHPGHVGALLEADEVRGRRLVSLPAGEAGLDRALDEALDN